MSKLKLYISSTFIDLEDVRKKILDHIHFRLPEYFEFTEVMEMMRGDGANRMDIDICLANVMDADVYILLTGARYGSFPPRYKNRQGKIIENEAEKSYTELEYDAACENFTHKLYHIYKFELTDHFFSTEKMDPKSDLADPTIAEKHARFKKKLNETTSTIKIDSLSKLGDEVNVLLAKTNLIFNSILNLEIGQIQKASINRTEQVRYLQNNLSIIGHTTNTASIVISTKGNEDAIDEFSIKVRTILTPNEPLETITWVDNNAISASIRGNDDEDEKALNHLLIASSFNILKAKARFVSFDTLYPQIKEHKIQNRYLGFIIDQTLPDTTTERYIKLINRFIGKIDDCLRSNGFLYNFFFIIYVITEKDIGKPFVQSNMPGFKTEYYELGRLKNVEITDINNWFNELISEKDEGFSEKFKANKEAILNQVFIDTRTFPKTYFECLRNINSRTVKR